jgi:hypothetical protein
LFEMLSSWVCWASIPVFEIHSDRIMARLSGLCRPWSRRALLAKRR